jgi:hypothetical protein
VNPTPGTPPGRIWSVVARNNVIDICGDQIGHFRSVNGGVTWTTATGIPLPRGQCSLAVSPWEPYVVFATVGGQVFETDDGGGTWNTTFNPVPPPRFQGRIPFVETNKFPAGVFDLWWGDIDLFRATCGTPVAPAPGGAARCPQPPWVTNFARPSNAHDDVGSLLFDPNMAVPQCPFLYSSDGGVYRNTIPTNPGCQNPQAMLWTQPAVTPHALWLWSLSGAWQPPAGANEDVYFGNQDNGIFGTRRGGNLKPVWNEPDCCDVFDTAAEPNRMMFTVCCGPGGANQLFTAAPGAVGPVPVNLPGNPVIPGFKSVPSVVNFGPNSYAVLTNTGVLINIAFPNGQWANLGAPPNACGLRASRQGGAPVFYVQAGSCDAGVSALTQVGRPAAPDLLLRYNGIAPGGMWQPVNPPGPPATRGGFGIFNVSEGDANLLMASQIIPPATVRMLRSNNAGATWQRDLQLEQMMIGAGTFRMINVTGPTDFTNFDGYPQPTLVAINPDFPRIRVGGGADSGVFLTFDDGLHWNRVTDPIHPKQTGIPHLPRPRFAYFENRGAQVSVFIGTEGRGVWRTSVAKPAINLGCPLAGGAVGAPYASAITAANFLPPITFAIGPGVLPPGLVLNAANGAVAGVPTAPGVFPFTVTMTDGMGNAAMLNCAIAIAGVSARLDVFRCMQLSPNTAAPYSLGVLETHPQFCDTQIGNPPAPKDPNNNAIATKTGLKAADGAGGFVDVFRCMQFTNALSARVGIGVLLTHPQFCEIVLGNPPKPKDPNNPAIAVNTGLKVADPGGPDLDVFRCVQFTPAPTQHYGVGVLTTHPQFCETNIGSPPAPIDPNDPRIALKTGLQAR